MSKLLKYTKGFDNNPNSDIAASKSVVKQYKKLLAKETLQPIIQEMNNQTKSVVTNLNDYSLLLKNITQNLVNANLYLSNPEVSKSKGAGRFLGGTRLSDKQKQQIKNNASKKNIHTSAQALDYIQEKYRDKPDKTKMTQPDKNLIKVFGLGNVKATTNAGKILDKIGNKKDDVEEEEEDFIDEIPEEEAEEYLFDIKSPKSPKVGIRIDQVMEGDRYALQPKSGNIHGGEPDLDETEEQNDDDEQEEEDDNFSFDSELLSETSNHSLGKYIPENDDAGDGGDDDDIDNLGDLIERRGNTPIRENFIITLFSTIINQVHKASDFWETNITPNLSDIPRLKMDSFIKSNAVNNFEKAIKRIEDNLISTTIKTHLNYLDNIYHNLTRSLDELFERMNIDINRYAGGLSSSSSNKPQLMGAGYLPFRGSVYSSHLRDSNTKYLM